MSDETSQAITLEAALDLLDHGEMAVRGLLAGSSNYTFLTGISNEQLETLAVYKPRQGETPLWDFPYGTLFQREMAAFLVSEALGWGLVPPTVVRFGPYGKGAVQIFIVANFEQHYFDFIEAPELYPVLQKIAAFDIVINNADRKGGHTLIDSLGRLWAIDHGVCFHAHPKLRTVIWEFAGQPLPGQLINDLEGLLAQLKPEQELFQALCVLINDGELSALMRRTEDLLDAAIFPDPDLERRSYPWPLI
ncbi:MAG: SCO1664 family protein [Chloroflexota bacterium]|nr:SCO1664 family protein [Chloroflexota bacterium]